MGIVSIQLADVIVSKGFEEKPAITFREDIKTKSGGTTCLAQFQVSNRNGYGENATYSNFTVKCWGAMATRLKRLKVDAGSHLIIQGTIAQEHFVSKDGTKRSPYIVTATSIEFCGGGYRPKDEAKQSDGSEQQAQTKAEPVTPKSLTAPNMDQYDEGEGEFQLPF